MYAIYKYKAGASSSNILSDLVALITGETVVSNLSSDCDQVNTSITSVVAPTWVLYEQISATRAILRAPYSDNASLYKYIEVYASSFGIMLFGYDSWDIATDTYNWKTQNTSSSTYDQGFDLTNGGLFHVFAGPNHTAIAAEESGNFGGNYNGLLLASEYTRDLSNNNNTMQSFCIIDTGTSLNGGDFAFPVVSPDKTGNLINTAAYVTSKSSGFDSWFDGNSFATAFILNGSDSEFELSPIYIGNASTYGHPIGNISEKSDVWCLPTNSLPNKQYFIYNTSNYISMYAYKSIGDIICFALRSE
jgi:hypothetical protein